MTATWISTTLGVQSAQGKSAERIGALHQSMLALSFTEGLSLAFAGELQETLKVSSADLRHDWQNGLANQAD